MFKIGIKKTLKGLEQKKQELEALRGEMRKKLEVEMFRVLTLVGSAIIGNIRSTFKRRTGLLMNSVENSKRIFWRGNNLTGVVGAQTVYAALHEFGSAGLPGGVIKPKRANFLKFPVSDNQNDDGSPKQKEAIKPVLLPLRSGDGFLLLDNLGETMRPLFVLKKSVEIPKRPYIGPAHERMEPIIVAKFQKFIKHSFRAKEE